MSAETPIGTFARAMASLLDLRAAGRDGTQRSIDAIKQLNDSNHGVVPTAVCDMSTAPTATDTVTIGADVYEFVAASGTVAADTNIAVTRTGTAGTDITNLINAINAINPTNAHANILKSDGTAALANGTENVKADEVGTDILRIRLANAPGGLPKAPDAAADASIALAESLTPAGAVWKNGDTITNLNVSPYRVAGPYIGCASHTIPASGAGGGEVYRFSFPFKVEGFLVGQILASTGVVQTLDTASQDDTWTIVGSDLLLTIGSTATNFAATDVISVLAWGVAEHS